MTNFAKTPLTNDLELCFQKYGSGFIESAKISFNELYFPFQSFEEVTAASEGHKFYSTFCIMQGRICDWLTKGVFLWLLTDWLTFFVLFRPKFFTSLDDGRTCDSAPEIHIKFSSLPFFEKCENAKLLRIIHYLKIIMKSL